MFYVLVPFIPVDFINHLLTVSIAGKLCIVTHSKQFVKQPLRRHMSRLGTIHPD